MSGPERLSPPREAAAGRTERLHRFSHGLRNKLAGLMEAVRFLDGDLPREQRDEITGFAERKFFEALREVEDLLDDFGVERGMGALQPAPLDLAHLLDRALEDVSTRLHRKEQHVELQLDGPLPVNGDAHYLFPLLQALLTNASKFSQRGAVLRVEGGRTERQVRIRVIDPGVGLSSDDLRDVFTRYAWLESRSTDGESQGRGTLARARAIAAAHGGSLEAASEGPGKESAFTLHLPLAQ